MATLLETFLQEQVDAKYSPEEQAALFGGKAPTRDELGWAAKGILGRQHGLEPGKSYSGGYSALGLFGDGDDYTKAKDLAERQAKESARLDALESKLTQDLLSQRMELSASKDLLGTNLSEMTNTSRRQAIESGLAPTKLVDEQITGKQGPVQQPFAAIPPKRVSVGDDSGAARQGLTGSDVAKTPFLQTLLANEGQPGGPTPEQMGGLLQELMGSTMPLQGQQAPGAIPLAEARAQGIPLSDLRIETSQADTELTEALRQVDPGLQDQTIQTRQFDENAPLPDNLIRQLALRARTDAQTQQAETMPPEVFVGGIVSGLKALGATDDYINNVVKDLPRGSMPVSAANNISTAILSAAGKRTNNQARIDLRRQTDMARKDAAKERYQFSSKLQQQKGAIDFTMRSALQNMAAADKMELQANEHGFVGEQNRLKAERDYEARLNLQANQQVFTSQENQLKRYANEQLAIQRGEQRMDLETLKHGFELEMLGKKGGKSQKDVMREWVLNLARKAPQALDDIVEILNTAPPGTDPFLLQNVRDGLAAYAKHFSDLSTVRQTINDVNNTEIYGQTIKERQSVLMVKRRELAQGIPEEGIPPLAPEKLIALDAVIADNWDLIHANDVQEVITKDLRALSVNEAGKIADVLVAKEDVADVKSKLFDANGNMNRVLVAEMTQVTLPEILGGETEGLAFSEGRAIIQKLFAAYSSAKLRPETGAAVKTEEWPQFKMRFVPNNWDSDESGRDKIERFERWLEMTGALVDPRGSRREMIQQRKSEDRLETRKSELLSDPDMTLEKAISTLEAEGLY